MMTRNKMLEMQHRDTARMHRKYVIKTGMITPNGEIVDFRNDLVENALTRVRKDIKDAQIPVPDFTAFFWHRSFAPLRKGERVRVLRTLATEYPTKVTVSAA